MKKYLLSLIVISVALLALSFVSAADVDNHSSDSAVAQETQPIIHVESSQSSDLGDTFDTFGWSHNSRHPRGLADDTIFGSGLGGSGYTPYY